MTTAIKHNDRVKIIDGGEVYSCYTEKFREMGFKDTERNDGFVRGDEGRVFAISDHPSQPNGLYAVALDDGRECLISGIGIVLVEDTATSIKINDMVRVIKSGKTYSTHTDMFQLMRFKNEYENSAWNEGEVGRVFDISIIQDDKKTLYALVHADGRECLINAEGIELVNESAVYHATITQIIDRLAKIESQLDQLAKHVNVPAKPKTAVEWFADEIATYDYDSGNGQLEIFISQKQFNQIKEQALLMETNQNCK
jgi:hypothetical protein